MFVRLDTPSQVGLYVYDNDKFIVESFRQDPMRAVIITDKRITRLRDLQSGLHARPGDQAMPDIAEECPQDNGNRQGRNSGATRSMSQPR